VDEAAWEALTARERWAVEVGWALIKLDRMLEYETKTKQEHPLTDVAFRRFRRLLREGPGGSRRRSARKARTGQSSVNGSAVQASHSEPYSSKSPF
jgi:hypothetical protein